jgi:hypothetical protein
MYSLNDYTPTPTTSFVGWFRMHDNPELQQCRMHASDRFHGNWTERLIEDLDGQDNRTSWGRGIPYEARRQSEFVATTKWRGNHPWMRGCTIIEVNYKTFTLWLANSHSYPEIIGND